MNTKTWLKKSDLICINFIFCRERIYNLIISAMINLIIMISDRNQKKLGVILYIYTPTKFLGAYPYIRSCTKNLSQIFIFGTQPKIQMEINNELNRQNK